jgi:RsiW-degrading membrane proteinase PrsW (M82 family)
MAYHIGSTEVFFALIGGLLPALLWLWFWLKEDKNPEPRRVLILTFVAGMTMAIVALFLEQIAQFAIKGIMGPFFQTAGIFVLLFVWAAIEEIAKYVAARKIAFRLPSFDEPVDALIYLITAALGFAALENILFLLKVFGDQGMIVGFITGNLRFLGATLLHVVTSAIVGASIAFSFFHKEKIARNVLGGLILATILHTAFNFFIIKSGGAGLLEILIFLWLAVIVLLFVFEKIKGLRKPNY